MDEYDESDEPDGFDAMFARDMYEYYHRDDYEEDDYEEYWEDDEYWDEEW